MIPRRVILACAALAALMIGGSQLVSKTTAVTTLAADPGVRCGDLGAGGPISGLTSTDPDADIRARARGADPRSRDSRESGRERQR